jgi:hypothetical protein
MCLVYVEETENESKAEGIGYEGQVRKKSGVQGKLWGADTHEEIF